MDEFETTLTNSEAFNKWWDKQRFNWDKSHFYDVARVAYKAGWQAAQRQSSGEIDYLKDKLESIQNLYIVAVTQVTALKADNERLREALKDADELIGIEPFEHVAQEAADAHYAIREALSSTASQSLQAHDNEVLSKLRVINWTESMSVAWHKAIPDLHKAFDDLIELLKGK